MPEIGPSLQSALQASPGVPSPLSFLWGSVKGLGNALGEAGTAGSSAYERGVSSIPTAASAGRATQGMSEAIPAALKGFYQKGGIQALTNLGLTAGAGYGAKKLYDYLRDRYAPQQPTGRNPYSHVF